jgi:hypothetical protein
MEALNMYHQQVKGESRKDILLEKMERRDKA